MPVQAASTTPAPANPPAAVGPLAGLTPGERARFWDLPEAARGRVLTWLGPEKAIAMAVHADGNGYGSPEGIYDIEVQELGPAERDERGIAIIKGYLSDRMEF